MTARPDITFIVPVLNDAARLRRCLASIAATGTGHEVIVVDNGSTDGSDRVAREAGATVLTMPRVPVSALRNAGAQAAQAGLLAFVDANHVIVSTWASAALTAFSDPAAAAVGAPYQNEGLTWVQRSYHGLRSMPAMPRPASWLGSGNLAIRAQAFRAVGGFDERLRTCEDVDLCQRLRGAGLAIVEDPALASTHLGNPTTLRSVFRGELWRGRDNLVVSFNRPFDARSIVTALVPAAALGFGTLAVLALAGGRLRTAALAAVLAVAPTVPRTLRLCMNLGRWTPRAVGEALLVATAYKFGRALGLVARAGHATRRRDVPTPQAGAVQAMKILMLTQRLPYAPNRGDRRRAYHLLKFLSAHHEVHLVSLVHDAEEAAHVGEMGGFAASVSVAMRGRVAPYVSGALSLAGDTPLTHRLLDGPDLRRTVEDVAARVKPDMVFAYCSGLAHFALRPPLLGLPFILDLVDVDSAKWRRYAEESAPPMSWVYAREARVLAAFEARAARAAVATLVVNERELAELRAIAPDANGIVVPNGIDLDELRSPHPPATDERVLFCGVMNYRPNHEGAVWFLREVWPQVRTARPGATLSIVGSEPSRALHRLARAAGNVEVTGHVPDVRPYYWRSSVFVAPLHHARGVQNKVLDAAAAGIPSVVTSAVLGGLPTQVSAACRVADDPDGFASEVVRLLVSSVIRAEVFQSARLERLSWPAGLSRLLEFEWSNT